jgi:hypothetical protein
MQKQYIKGNTYTIDKHIRKHWRLHPAVEGTLEASSWGRGHNREGFRSHIREDYSWGRGHIEAVSLTRGHIREGFILR